MPAFRQRHRIWRGTTHVRTYAAACRKGAVTELVGVTAVLTWVHLLTGVGFGPPFAVGDPYGHSRTSREETSDER